jgi:predicted dithiol-disulfide oxidoreductase (DUF899 family)
MTTHRIVSREEWIEARKQHLAKEKELTRLRDQLSQSPMEWLRHRDRYEDRPQTMSWRR